MNRDGRNPGAWDLTVGDLILFALAAAFVVWVI
jgi:hypothetical protein